MASEYYIDQMLSPEAAQQLDKMVASAEKLLELQVKINNSGSGGTSSHSGQAKDFDAAAKAADNVTKSLQNLQVAEQSVTQSTVQNKTDMQALNAVYKLNAIAASENTTQLQKLYAQQELANRAAQEAAVKFGYQSEQFLSATKAATNYSAEITKLELATSKMKGSTNSMYGATFSLTQIMRELPNFAISARIGFMSLSNNIPMLIDSFKILSQQIDKTTGKPIGAAGAFKEFAKSLLSFNTIAIVASTLLVLFGDDMVKFIGKLFSAKNATVVFSTAQQAMIDQMSKMDNQTHSTVGKVMELGVAIDGYKRGIGSSDSVVKLYNETLGTHYGKLKNINDVLAAYPKYAQDFIDYTIRLNASMTLASQAGDQFLRSKTNETILSKFNPSDVKKVEDSMRLLADRIRSGGGDVNQVLEDIKSKSYFALNNLHGGFENYKDDFTDVVKGLKGGEIIASSIANKWAATVAYNQLSKSAKEIFPGLSEKDNSQQRTKTLALIQATEEFYDHQREMLLEQMVKLEEKANKSSLDGTLNAYSERYQAAKDYFIAAQQLYESDKNVAIQKENEKVDNEEAKIKRTYENNVSKFKDNQEKINQTKSEYNKAFAILENNRALMTQKIEDEAAKKELDNQQKYVKTYQQIQSDKYKDDLDDLKLSETKKQALLDQFATKQKNELENRTTGEILLKSFTGYDKDTAVQSIEIESKANEQKIQNKIDTLKKEKDLAITNQKEVSKAAIENYYNEKEQELIADAETLKIKADLETDPEKKKKLQSQANSLMTGVGDLEQQKSSALQEIELRSETSDTIQNIDKELANQEILLQTNSAEKRLAIEKAVQDKIKSLKTQVFDETYKVIETTISGFYDRYYQKLDDEKDYYSKIETEKEQDIEDRVKAGVITEKEGEKEKANLKVWAQGQQDAIDAKEKEAKKQQFLIDQAMALGKIWINYAVSVASIENMLAFGAFTPLYTALAVASTALVAAQTIPYFKDGGTVDKDGIIGVGDGGKRELMITPKGDWYITPDTTTHVVAEKGTKIFSDAAKIDMLSLASISNTKGVDLSTIEQQMVGLRKDLSRQKPTRLSPVSTLEAIKYGNDFNIRKRGI